MEKQVLIGDGGSLIVENVSTNPANTLFRIDSFPAKDGKKKSFYKRFLELFRNQPEASSTIYFSRNNAKILSSYIYTQLTAADKVYKESRPAKAKKPTKSNL
jgi:hypothetical protein